MLPVDLIFMFPRMQFYVIMEEIVRHLPDEAHPHDGHRTLSVSKQEVPPTDHQKKPARRILIVRCLCYMYLWLAVRWLFCSRSCSTRCEIWIFQARRHMCSRSCSSRFGQSALCSKCTPIPSSRCSFGEISNRSVCSCFPLLAFTLQLIMQATTGSSGSYPIF